jgi:hypothetical protein
MRLKLTAAAFVMFMVFASLITSQARGTQAQEHLLAVTVEKSSEASFLQATAPTLARLKGKISKTTDHRNTVLARDERVIVMTFPTRQASEDFMLSAAKNEGGESELYVNCQKETGTMICIIKVAGKRYACWLGHSVGCFEF